MPAISVKTRTADPVTAIKRCGLYVRVSTEQQVDRCSLSTQEVQLREYATNHHWHIAKVFVDAGLSAKNTARPAFQEMLKWAKQGKIDVIVVAKIDRISRNLIDLLTLIEDLKLWGVDFVSASQAFDTSTPMGTLILSLLGSFAQFEREMIADRVRENMLERAKKGVWSGGKCAFGYTMNPDTKFLGGVPAEAQIVQDIFAEFLSHKSVRRTGHTMNAAGKYNREKKPWSLNSIRRILTNPTYVGTLCYGKRTTKGSRLVSKRKEDWINVENAHEAIVEKISFDEVQAILSQNIKPSSWTDSSPHLLSGLGRCGKCGSRIIGMTFREKGTGKIQYRYYRCLGRIQKGKTFCDGVSYRTDDLDKAIVSQITGFDIEFLRNEIKQYEKRTAKERGPLLRKKELLTNEFERFREKEAKLIELYEDSIIDIALFKERRSQLEKQKLAIAAELTDIESRLPENMAVINVDALTQQFANLQQTFASLSISEQRRLLKAMVSEYTVWPDGRVEIDLNLLDGLYSVKVPVSQGAHYEEVA